jgi:hypothetical protein
MTSKKKARPARQPPGRKRQKPRGEQLLDRIDKNPNDQEAWNELARASPKIAVRKKKFSR